ncbi:MAG TPA: hypothetical protein VGO94_14900 [Mycobacteriales bacterium]|jgi:hypothetical protein|nr:hypothetical protein [Cryptosporangiaceae bacterium]MDQ1676365.1 hypothetical protein [Actinomycetota bacterium]HEV7757141.1 hypothetical protein [Mycobacteriales bacterium]
MIGALCLILAGFLSGGAYSVARQGGSRVAVGILGTLAAIAAAAGVLWLF